LSTKPIERRGSARGSGKRAPNAQDKLWPGLSDVPGAPARAKIAKMLFRLGVRDLAVRVRWPDGSVWGSGGPSSPVMSLVRPNAFFRRLGADAKIGFGESYMVGDWTTDDLPGLLTPFAERIATLIPPKLQAFRRFAERRQPKTEENTVSGARENIHRHYDLSNEMFATFLDSSMTYSSALFDGVDTELRSGQQRKLDSVLDYAGVKQGTHLVEIGTGWGSLALRAAERGARVTTLTISAEQKALAEQRIAEAGASDKVKVLLRDYREAHGNYDAAVSVEMIEAVGQKYWPTYFAALDRLVKPGGRVGLQAITMPHDRMLASASSYTWIHRYVFPGGVIPSVQAIEQTLAEHTTMKVREFREFGQDYAETLRQWRERFLSQWSQVTAMGFDDTFRRMWEFYLAYSEAGFRSRYLRVHQFSLARP
jgi:cyclopropane-fatty-acyl-phospholipid synthase